MKWISKILKFLFIFLIVIEILSQIVGFQQNNRIYVLGTSPYMKTPSRTYWKKLYKKVIADTVSYYQYDSLTGWTNRANSTSKDGLYHFNNDGIRGNTEYSKEPDDDIIRIVLLGNSAVFSAEVADTNALGFYLEEALKAKGQKVEVLNMGVGSFSNDQSLLRWRHKAKSYSPDIVVQGVHMWDFWINLNIYKYCMFPPTGIVYTKPRAVLEADTLRWVNYPTVPPAEIYDSIILNYEDQTYFKHEYFNNRKRYGQNILDNIYLYQILRRANQDMAQKIDDAPEGKALMVELVRAFQKEVEAENSQYILLKLASFKELLRIKYLKESPNADFWTVLEKDKTVFSTFPTLGKEKETDVFVASHSHYSSKGNRLIGEVFANYLIENRLLKKKTH